MVVLTDPRETVKNLFTPGHVDCKINDQLLLDRKGGKMKCSAEYFGSLETVVQKYVEDRVDLLFVVGKGQTSILGGYANEYVVSVQACALDKKATDGDVRVDAATAIWLAELEILRILRENRIGSYRDVKDTAPENLRLSPGMMWSQIVNIHYTQLVSAYGTYSLANRRFFAAIREIRIGYDDDLAADEYSSIGPASGLGPVSWDMTSDPFVEIEIPGGNSIVQDIGRKKKHGVLSVVDSEAVTQLLKTQPVDEADGDPAITSLDVRTVIGYFVIVTDVMKVVNLSDGRTAVTSAYAFSGAQITKVSRQFDKPGSPIQIEWIFDSEAQTDT